MSAIRISLSVLLVALLAIPARAQNAVQLPTLSSFQTRSTVSVPDRGSVYTGGINRAADGRNEFGTPLLPLRNRAIGSQRSASSVWTSVYIHDFEAMEEALLGQASGSSYRAPQRRSFEATQPLVDSPRTPGQSQPAAAWQVRSTTPTSGPMSKSVAELRAEHAGEQQARLDEARNLFERGKAAEANGKSGVAKIYYRQAARRAHGPLQQEIMAHLELVTTPTVAQR